MEKAYHFKIRVKLPDNSTREEDMTVTEARTKFGSALALGKIVRHYDNLKAYKEILDYRVLTEQQKRNPVFHGVSFCQGSAEIRYEPPRTTKQPCDKPCAVLRALMWAIAP